MSDVAARIRAFLAHRYRLDRGGFNEGTPMFSSGLLDSFAMVELVAFVEKQVNIKVRPRDLTLENFDSIERICRYLERGRM